jgi:hypothetical protein
LLAPACALFVVCCCLCQVIGETRVAVAVAAPEASVVSWGSGTCVLYGVVCSQRGVHSTDLECTYSRAPPQPDAPYLYSSMGAPPHHKALPCPQSHGLTPARPQFPASLVGKEHAGATASAHHTLSPPPHPPSHHMRTSVLWNALRAMVCGDATGCRGADRKRSWKFPDCNRREIGSLFSKFDLHAHHLSVPAVPVSPCKTCHLLMCMFSCCCMLRWHRWRCLAVWACTSCDRCPP